MLHVTYAVLTIGIFFALVFLYTRVRFAGVAGLLTKTIASLFFIFTALSATFANSSNLPYALLLVCGLTFSMLGDIFLDLKSVYAQDSELHLYAGMSFFSLAHIFYVTAIVLLNNFLGATFFALLTAAATISLTLVGLEKFVGLEMGKFKLASFLYGTFLTMTLFSALYVGFTRAFTYNITLLTVGGFFFLLSDLILSQIYFKRGNRGKENNPAWLVVVNHATYYVAQFLIAMSIVFA